MINDKLTLRGDLLITLKDKDGKVKVSREEKNLIVDVGLAFICSRMTGTSAATMSHMAVGSNNTPASATDTDLGSILGSRVALDLADSNNNTVTYTASFSAGVGTGAIVEAGIFNASTGGTMLCHTVFPVVNKGVDDVMSISWSVSLSAA